jgi:uncharacterized membrane protein
MNLTYYILITLGFAGLVLAYYIQKKKRLAEPLICPIGADCDRVIHSRYSRLFNVPVETVGAVYYSIVLLTYAIFFVSPELHSAGAALVILEITAVAFLFSLYLTGVQIFVLREWCTWCIISALLCTVILYLELTHLNFDAASLIRSAFPL